MPHRCRMPGIAPWAALSIFCALFWTADWASAQDHSERGETVRKDLWKKVIFLRKRILLDERIHFVYNKAKIRKRSWPILTALAEKLKLNPQVEKIRIEGHTCIAGPAKYNLWLSRKRAKAVMKFLISRGVDAKRLVSKGYGQEWPIAPNLTSRERQKNRRVEFVLVQVHRRSLWLPGMDNNLGRVLDVRGTAIKRRNGRELQLVVHQPVLPGDTIHSGEKARVFIRFEGGLLMILGANTQLKIKDIQLEPKESSNSVTLEFIKGRISLEDFGLTGQVPLPKISLKSGTISGRGYMRLSGTSDKSLMEVIKGEYKFESPGKTQARTIYAGQGFSPASRDRDKALFQLLARPNGLRPAMATFSHTLKLKWKPVAGAVNHLLEISPQPEFVHLKVETILPAKLNQFTTSANWPKGKYYWRITPIGKMGGQGLPSQKYSFSLGK